MCLITSFLNAAYVTLLIAGFALSMAAFLTPQWTIIEVVKNDTDIVHGKAIQGLLFGCDIKQNSSVPGWKGCVKLEDLNTAGNVTVVACSFTILFCLVGLAWSIVTCLACCCKSCLTKPLAIFSGLALLSVIVALGAFGSGYKSLIEPLSDQAIGDGFEQRTTIGLSFKVGAGACAVLLADTIIAVLLILCSKVPFA